MEILASPPLRAGSVLWQEQPGQWTLTVVCKATYALAPGEASLAPEQEDVNEQDNHWDDDPQRSVYAPGDLAPFKLRPEVMLVGSAFAPSAQPARALVARVVVGELDKSIEVFGLRARDSDGSLREGPRWRQMPLRYERAAGGPASWNPVGVSATAVDTHGRRVLPSLQPPGPAMIAPDEAMAPIGFGPLAATWPTRRDKLRRGGAGRADHDWNDEPLGEAFDGTFFQAAPLDQRIDVLRPDEPIVLENLHPEHPRLVTRLPGVRPRARVETPDLPSWELTLVADTLWIDTNRALCTLTWRGQIPLDGRDQPGLVRVGLEEPGRPARFPSSPEDTGGRDAGPAPDAPRPPRPSYPSIYQVRPQAAASGDEGDLAHTAVDDSALVRLAPVAQDKPVLPFQRAPRLDGEMRAALAPKSVTGLPRTWDADEERQGETAQVAVTSHPRMPSWLDAPPPSAPRPAAAGAAVFESPPQRPAPPPPPPVSAMLFNGGSASRSGSGAAPLGGDRGLATAAYAGVLEASNAAAGAAPPPSQIRVDPATAAGSTGPRSLVDLLWFDAARVPRLRKVPAWAPFLRGPAGPPTPPTTPPDEAQAAEEKARAERADVLGVLTRATPVGDVEGAILDAATEDGALESPLLVVAGELELPFDEIAMLDALLGAAASLAAGDKKLKEVIDLATEVMKTPLGGSPGVAAGFVARVREAWSRANRLLPGDYLDLHTRRLLLEKRAYQKRQLNNEVWIRALLTQPGESAPIPAYLPEALGRWLPLFARFPARLLAEAVPQQDQSETHPVALRVAALARVVTGRARGRS